MPPLCRVFGRASLALEPLLVVLDELFLLGDAAAEDAAVVIISSSLLSVPLLIVDFFTCFKGLALPLSFLPRLPTDAPRPPLGPSLLGVFLPVMGDNLEAGFFNVTSASLSLSSEESALPLAPCPALPPALLCSVSDPEEDAEEASLDILEERVTFRLAIA